MRLRNFLALLAVLALVAAACSGGDETTTTDGETTDTEGSATTEGETDSTDDGGAEAGGDYCDGFEGGELLWAHEQEPPDMHLNDPNNNLSVTAYLWQGVWEDLHGISASVEYHPELLATDGTITENADGSVTHAYELRDGLVWSDGEPITSEDVEFTYNVIMEGVEDGAGVYLIGSRQGYDLITDFNVTGDLTFEITYSRFFAGWRSLFTNVFPSHAFGEGAGAAEVNAALPEFTNADGEILPSSGPLLFESWERGVSMTFVRNDNYHGTANPDAVNQGVACIDRVRINWVADTDSQINAMKAGEAHVIFAQPQLAFEELNASDSVVVDVNPGPTFEHWGLNVLNAHLAKSDVREALAYALDKGQVVTTLYAPVFGDALPLDGLGNTYWMTNQSPYEDHQSEYTGPKVDEAKAALEGAGYVLGDDGIYEHPDDGRLSLRVGTTGGNALRELQQQIIQAQMKSAGIEIVIDNVPGTAYFTDVVFSGEGLLAAASGGEQGDPNLWDITQFAWVGGPWPGGQSASYLSGAVADDADGNPVAQTNNPYGYTTEGFDAQSPVCDETVDDAERAACYNELDRLVTQVQADGTGLFMLPLTQKPQFYAWHSDALEAAGKTPDVNNGGPLVNIVDFKVKG